MTSTANPRGDSRMCSVVASTNGEDPIGCAIYHERYLIVEVALPWAAEIAESKRFPRGLAEVPERAEARGDGPRFLAVAPDKEYSRPGMTRVIDLRRPAAPFACYERDEYVVDTGQVVDLVTTLLERPVDRDRFARYRETGAPDWRDLLVCTHGTHDRCCATLGYPIYQRLRRHDAARAGDRLRVWRVSHFGGHRFAPTLVDVPEMRFWGPLDAEAADRLARRAGPLPDLWRCYRGWAALEGFFEVVAEREMFAREGWAWLDFAKSGQVLGAWGKMAPLSYPVFDDVEYRGEARIDFVSGDGRYAGRYEATVEPTGAVVKSKDECDADELMDIRLYHVTRLVRQVERDERAIAARWRGGPEAVAGNEPTR